MSLCWISPEEAADRTPLSRKAIYGAIRRGELPASKRCGRWMIAETDLEHWIEGGALVAPASVAAPRRRARGARSSAGPGSLAALRSIEAEARG